MNTEQPLVSIIIPTYNRAHLIGETLDSVLAQSYNNWECIVVDDGSTDGTDEVMERYVAKDARFKYYHRPPEHLPGGNGARNFGFKMSQGAYVQWFDSDDLMLENFLEKKVNKFQDDVQIVISKRLENGEVLEYKSMEESILKFTNFDRKYIIERYSIITGDVMFSKKIINQLFDENLYKAQEMEFFTRIFDQNLSYFFLNDRLWNHRGSSDSISSKSNRNLKMKVKSLVYLSKKLQRKYIGDYDVLKTVKNYGVVLYKSLMLKSKYGLLLRYFHFFRSTHNLGFITFSFFFIYNSLFKKGFYSLKKKGIENFKIKYDDF